MPTNVVLKNLSQLHTLRARPQSLEAPPAKTKTGAPGGPNTWKDVPVDGYITPGQTVDVWLGEGRRVILEEMPT